MDSKVKKLKSSDGKEMEIDEALLQKSKLLKGLLEDYQGDDDVIPLNEVDYKNLEHIKEYLIHYKDMEPKEFEKPFPENADEAFLKSILNDDWTFDFLQKLSIEDSVDLINCAHYLQIEELINLLSAKLAYEMLNCEPKEVLNKFALKCNVVNEENNG